MKTIICLIIDESGSMVKNREDIVCGYNKFISEQTNLEEDATFFLVKFNSVITIYYSDERLEKIPRMTETMYNPRGGTALYDAIVAAINDVDKYKKKNERVICAIVTDGEDNHSFAYQSDVKEMMAQRMAKDNWSFIYIGECSQQFAQQMGISADNAADYSRKNVEENFEKISNMCTSLRIGE